MCCATINSGSKNWSHTIKIILSPRPPVSPRKPGLLLDVIRTYAGRKPILGVCLGEQAIGQAFGGKLVNLEEVFHGVQTEIRRKEERLGTRDEGLGGKDYEGISLEEDYIFCGLPNRIPVGRYHSWVVDTKEFPDELAITAISPEGQIMALKHREYDIHGIQFHPESVLTPDGKNNRKKTGFSNEALQKKSKFNRQIVNRQIVNKKMKAILTRLFNHEELTSEETKQILLNITKEMYPEAQIAALLTAFQMRSITVDELIGFRELMETRLPIDFAPYHPIDIVGTGGDGKNTFNISTCACFVVAGAGYKVAKHGN